MIPEEFHGAWKRVSIALDGGPPQEPQHVVWVQASAAFADLRVPDATWDDLRVRDPLVTEPSAFAGTTVWQSPFLVWHHEMGRGPLAGPPPGDGDDLGDDLGSHDRGEVSWQDGDLVERGVLERGDRAVPYVEVWRRTTPPGAPVLALTTLDGTGRIVQVGDHAVTMVDGRPTGGEILAAYRVRRRGRASGPGAAEAAEQVWETVLSLGHDAASLPLPPAEPPAPAAARLPVDGHPWHVLEASAGLS